LPYLYPSPVRSLLLIFIFVLAAGKGLGQDDVAGFNRVRRSQNVDSEYHYVVSIYEASVTDTSLIATELSTLQKFADDVEVLLSHKSDAAQKGAIDGMYNIAAFYYISHHLEAASRAGTLATRVNARLHQHCTRPYYILTAIYLSMGKTREALAAALEGVRAGETAEGAVNCFGYEAAAMAYFSTGDYDKCLEYYQRSAPYFLKDSSLVYDAGHLLYRATQILLQQHREAEARQALDLFRQRLKRTWRIESEMRYYQLASAGYYHAMGKNDSAEYYYQRSLRYLPAGINNARITILHALAGFYVDTRQWARAKPLLDTLTSGLARPFISFVNLESTWWLRHRTDSALQDYRQALLSLHQYLLLHDSLTNVAKNRQLAEMNVQYETDRKNEHIAELEKQTALQTRLQQAADRQHALVRNSLIAGAALLTLLAGLLYSRYRTRRRTNRQLQRLLDDKEWLLREVHHRVKNNLQIIISLLRTQSYQLKDESAINAFEQISARVNAISLVHKKLYQENQDMASIDIGEYVEELVANLSDGLALHISFRLDIQPLSLDVAQCVPLGLILNEAITNAIKHAFSVATAGCPEIVITLREEPAGPHPAHPAAPHPAPPGVGSFLHLCIADNGTGLPPDAESKLNSSFGLQLIDTLAHQLEGTLTVRNDSGLHIRVRFPRNPERSRPEN